jgi:hypothetical protein
LSTLALSAGKSLIAASIGVMCLLLGVIILDLYALKGLEPNAKYGYLLLYVDLFWLACGALYFSFAINLKRKIALQTKKIEKLEAEDAAQDERSSMRVYGDLDYWAYKLRESSLDARKLAALTLAAWAFYLGRLVIL